MNLSDMQVGKIIVSLICLFCITAIIAKQAEITWLITALTWICCLGLFGIGLVIVRLFQLIITPLNSKQSFN